MTINELVTALEEPILAVGGRGYTRGSLAERNLRALLLDLAKRAQGIAYLLVAAHIETWKPCSCGKIQGARYSTTSGHADSCAGFVVASIREMGADTKEFDAGSRAAWEQATPEQRKNWDRDGGAPDNKNLVEARLALELVEERGLHVSGELGPCWLVVDRGAFGNLQFVLFGGAAPSPEPLRTLRDLIRAAAAEIGYRATGDDFGMVEAEAIILEKLGLK
jgi:hypothetical protein